jgi:hypothetical protein
MVNLTARCWCLSDTLRPEKVDTAPVGIKRAATQSNRTALGVIVIDMQARSTLNIPRGVQTFIIKDDILWQTLTTEILL